MNDWVGDPYFSRSGVSFLCGRRRMGEDEVVGCQMQGSFNLLPLADESDVVYLKMVSCVFSNSTSCGPPSQSVFSPSQAKVACPL